MDEELRKKIEAVLFSSGKKVHIDDLRRMVKEKDRGKLVACLIELKKKYNDDLDNSLMVLQDGDLWKLTIKDQYIDVAKEIGVETEMPKTLMETLAVIAYKYPILQSDLIKIRTNKAYDHLKELEEIGYIQRERHGRTKTIKLTQKFFDYFDLPPDKLKENFSNVRDMEKVIEEKEKKIKEINDMKKEKIEQQKIEEREEEKKNIFMGRNENPNVRELIEKEEGGLEIIKEEKLGDLVIIDEEPFEEKENIEEKRDKEIGLIDSNQIDGEKKGDPDLDNKDEVDYVKTGERFGDFEVVNETDCNQGQNIAKKEDKEADSKRGGIGGSDEDRAQLDTDKRDNEFEKGIEQLQAMKDEINKNIKEDFNEKPREEPEKEMKDNETNQLDGIETSNNSKQEERGDNKDNEENKNSEGNRDDEREIMPASEEETKEEEKEETRDREISKKKKEKDPAELNESVKQEEEAYQTEMEENIGHEGMDEEEYYTLPDSSEESEMKKIIGKESFAREQEREANTKEDEGDSNQDHLLKDKNQDDPFKLKEDKLFLMDGLPPEIMNKIDEKAESILGENRLAYGNKQNKNNKKDAEEND
jgi:segregation and condensation protein B